MKKYAWMLFVPMLVLLSGAPLAAQTAAPPLPPGLDGDNAPGPALPPGLDDKPSGPALPPGLGDEPGGPALPPGLGDGATSGPALPPGLDAETTSESVPEEKATGNRLPDLHGFWELRGGLRTQDDPAQPKTATIGESRLQLQFEQDWKQAVFDFTGDLILDGALEEADFDLRQARITTSLGDHMDLRIGRQVLTWGTGDMLFINDLFPKDWQSFFIGRNVEYLKAPSDAARLGFYSDLANIDVVYVPQFESDRYITGERISYWDPLAGKHSGRNKQVDANPPSDWFSDDELALRAYRRFGTFEAALYGYWGYWKSPGGQSIIPLRATFPRLAVYGGSVRGPVGRGIINAEFGYYDSRDDSGGGNFLVNNSEVRLLLGYERELAKDFTGAVQYYLEHMQDYKDYNRTRPFFMPQRDRDRHVVTLRLTKLLMDQNLTLSFFGYYSPSDGDAYLRPNVSYKVNDDWSVEAGGNVFLGESDTTFFGQFSHNTNVYGAVRYSF